MKYLWIILLGLFSGYLLGQNGDAYVISQQGWVQFGMVQESWKGDDGFQVKETSFPVSLYLPLGRAFSLSLRGNQASAGGDELTDLKGLTDTQIQLSSHLEAAHLVFSLGVNLPSGKKELTMEEFETAMLMSLNQLDFYTPNWGQGLNLSPGVTWALPLSDNFVLGLGASYQIKGKYKPIKDMEEDYQPGNELSVTAGFDFRLAESATFSGDVLWTQYGEDKLGSETVFQSGRRMVISGLYRQYFGYNQFTLLGRYRSSGKNSLAIGGELVEEEQRSTPNQLEVLANYRMRLSRAFYLTLGGEYRKFDDAGVTDALNLFGFSLAPEIHLSDRLALPVRVSYRRGKFAEGDKISGYVFQGGLQLKF